VKRALVVLVALALLLGGVGAVGLAVLEMDRTQEATLAP
jgi:hypothetical protein